MTPMFNPAAKRPEKEEIYDEKPLPAPNRMYIGNEKGWIATVELDKPCDGEDCLTVSYSREGVMRIE